MVLSSILYASLASSMISQVVEVVDVNLNQAFAGKYGKRISGDFVVAVDGRKVTVVIEPYHTRFGRSLDLHRGDLIEIDHGLTGERARVSRNKIRRAN